MAHPGMLRALLAAAGIVLAVPAAAQVVFGVAPSTPSLATPQRPLEDPYVYIALRAVRFVQYTSRWVDTFDDPQPQVRIIEPGNYARIFVKYRSSSPAAKFFQAGTTYMWRAPNTIPPDKHKQGNYGHYVVEGAVTPEQVQAPCWYDVTRTEIDTQSIGGGSLTYLRGSEFILGAVNWNFAWESSTPDHVAQWRWRYASAPDNLMDLPLRKLTAADIRQAMTSRTIEGMDKADRQHIDVRDLVRRYGSFINRAAAQFRLSPELVAAILIAEQRDQKDEISVFVKGWYVGTWSSKTVKEYGGLIGWAVNMDASIGLGQVRPRTAKAFNLGNAGAMSTSDISRKLADPEFNILASAQYARIIADAGARYTKRDYLKILNAGQDRTFLASLSLADFSKHSLDWTAGHVILLGSEYTSAMWDGKYKLYWGLAVLRAYHDVLNLDVCK